VLEGKERFSLDDFRKLQHDTLSLPGQALARLIRTVGVDDPTLKPYADLLSSWNGVLSEDSRAGVLYAAWLRELTDGYFRLQVPEDLVSFVASNRGLERMLDTLAKPDSFWFGPKPAARRDELVRGTFAAAVKKLQKVAPKGDLSRLTWGQLHTAYFRHPLSSLGPAYAEAFDLAPVPRPGDVYTVNNTRHDETWRQVHGASYRHLFDLSDWDRGLATSVPGQSGQPGSPHYADLLPLWARGEYFPLVFSRKRVERETRHRLLLRPGASR